MLASSFWGRVQLNAVLDLVKEQAVSDRAPASLTGLLAIAAIGTIAAFASLNYAYHYEVLPSWISRSAAGYFVAVQLPFGIILPSILLGLRARQPGTYLSGVGVWLSARGMVGAVAALIVGALAVIVALGVQELTNVGLARLGALFAQLLVASTAEVLVFTGLLFGVARGWCRGLGRCEMPVAMLISALGFGLFHFTYPPPWAAWNVAFGLTAVWIVVNLVFLMTHALLAAVLFNNCMAMIGFVQNNLTLPMGVPFSLASWLIAAGIGLGVLVALSRGAPDATV